MIIIGVDFSAGSAAAASVALELAGSLGAPWRLLHVRSTMGLEPKGEGDAESWLDLMAVRRADVELRHGVPWIELVRAAGESKTSLLVVGTHGWSGFQPLRLGRTAEAISLRSPAPVLLVSATRAAASAAAHEGTSTISQEGS